MAIQSVNPKEAYSFLQSTPNSVLLDVRDRIEFGFVGHPVGAVNVPWKDARDWQTNPNFVDEIRQRISNLDTPILLMCRSGQRSMEAAKTLSAAGYRNLYNIDEGFEGALDDQKHRSSVNGWRFRGLPWEQS